MHKRQLANTVPSRYKGMPSSTIRCLHVLNKDLSYTVLGEESRKVV